MAELTFVSLFESDKDKLRTSLEGCTLPKDSQKLQTTVSQYLNQMFDSDGDLRMSLTQSEDYILQAAISLLNAQQQIATKMSDNSAISTKEMSETKNSFTPNQTHASSISSNKSQSLSSRQVGVTSAIGGSAIGSIGGGLLLGTWGAVFGAIAGTALVIYLTATTQEKTEQTIKTSPNPQITTNAEKLIDVDQYLSIIHNLCQSLDSLIDTFRAQIRRVVQKYESQESPVLEREYKVLLEGIQSLIGYKRGHSSTEPKYLSKLQTRIEDVVDLLDNYNLTVVDYTPENSQMFEELTSSNVNEPQLIAPAIIKDGNVVLKGKVFVKE